MRLHLNPSAEITAVVGADRAPPTTASDPLKVGMGPVARVWDKVSAPIPGLSSARLRNILRIDRPGLKSALFGALMAATNLAGAAPWQVNLDSLRASADNTAKGVLSYLEAYPANNDAQVGCFNEVRDYVKALPGRVDDEKIGVLEAGANLEAINRWVESWNQSQEKACAVPGKVVPLPDPNDLLDKLLAASKQAKALIPESEVLCLEECIKIYRGQLEAADEEGRRSGDRVMAAAHRVATILGSIENRTSMLENWASWPEKIAGVQTEIDQLLAAVEAAKKAPKKGADLYGAEQMLVHGRTLLAEALIRVKAGLNDPPISETVAGGKDMIARAKGLIDPQDKKEDLPKEGAAPEHWEVSTFVIRE